MMWAAVDEVELRVAALRAWSDAVAGYRRALLSWPLQNVEVEAARVEVAVTWDHLCALWTARVAPLASAS